MQIQVVQTGFEPLECKFELFKRDSNANSSYGSGIWTFRMQIRTTRIQIRAIQTGFIAFECKSEPLECKLQPFQRDLKHSI